MPPPSGDPSTNNPTGNPAGLAAVPQAFTQPSLQQGADAIRQALARLELAVTASSGVYRMLDDQGTVLYVGKAKQLHARVSSYTRITQLTRRIRLMVSMTRQILFVTTHTEAEALLLEAEMIKRLKPRFNILLRDDKSFPELLIRADHAYSRLVKHRGSHKFKGEYFGPYANARAVNVALDELQKSFRLRTCSDSVFRNRSRPCLLHQMKRCSAPCVDLISPGDYAQLIRQARDFLRGKSAHVQEELARGMEESSADMHYEKAAEYRDRLAAMTQIQSRFSLPAPHPVSADVMAISVGQRRSCVYVYIFRQGRHCGAQPYFIHHAVIEDADPVEIDTNDKLSDEEERGVGKIFAAFIGQFYQGRDIPRMLLLNNLPDDSALLSEALCRHGGHAVQIHVPLRGDKLKLAQRAETEAETALKQRQGQLDQHLLQWEALVSTLDIAMLERIEAYDNSHLNGSHPVGVMIAADQEGFDKKSYRKFNIRGQYAAGDDYAFMNEVLQRRLAKLSEADTPPDLLLIDGGKGQVAVARQLLETLNLGAEIHLVGIVKGPGRDAAHDRLLFKERDIYLAEHPEVAMLMQRLRDEAHRFAIGAQRDRRKAGLQQSKLDDVPNIGSSRKRALLRHFGSAKAVMAAGVDDLAAAPAISAALAQQIYDYFH